MSVERPMVGEDIPRSNGWATGFPGRGAPVAMAVLRGRKPPKPEGFRPMGVFGLVQLTRFAFRFGYGIETKPCP